MRGQPNPNAPHRALRLFVAFALAIGSVTWTLGSGDVAEAAVIQPFAKVYDKVVYGDFTIIGNTVVRCPAGSSPLTPVPCADGANRVNSGAVNDYYSMRWADVDANPATYDSSSAALTIPAGASVDHVRLHWAGSTGTYTHSDGNQYQVCSSNAIAVDEDAVLPPGVPQLQALDVKVGGAAAASVTPQTFVAEPTAPLNQGRYYGASADITSLFTAAPTGSPLTVTVGNVWAAQGYNCFGGWSLTLVYAFPQAEPTFAPVPREVFVYDGHVRQDSVAGPTTVPVNGFHYPGGPLRAGVTAYEGDWGIVGDQFLVNGVAVTEPSGSGLSNFFVDSAGGAVNPNSPNNYSVDAKDFTLPPGTLAPGATSLNLTFSTSGDSYLAQQLAFSVPLPTLNVVKEVCAAGIAADCGSGGAGPWVDATTLPRGSTAYWRIRVTNPSPVDVFGATLNDPAVPACTTAAGAFDVPATQTRTFYCSSPNLTAAVVNSVTALFVPTGSAPGTPPVETSPDTARADVYGLAVGKETCTSRVAAECGPGGAGPWTELATVPEGSTAFWRVLVTNTGSVVVNGITLNDAAEPGCVAAAGTFSVAAGASVPFYCSTANVLVGRTNVVTAQFAPPGSPPGTPPVQTAPDDARVQVSSLVVAKEVCGSTLPGDCAVGGAGPWGESTTIPTGATAYWRITVTNTGEANLGGISLQDAVESSCATTAGSFALAVDSSVSFYCSTANLTASATNAVTASYVPPGSPPGTTPVVSPPDSATANVYGLSVAKQVCTSLNAADCASPGVGPWVETANIPSGSSAFWRITATNTGTLDLTGITLADLDETSCVASAGSFALAASASVSFYCSTANVTTAKTNTVAAMFTPPGGSPTTTAPDSASVQVTNLAVLKDVCASTVAADCASTGGGPWVESTAIPTGATAFWRITATNTGAVDLTGIALNDVVEASCVSTAGSFALTAGASTSFYCASSGLAANTTNSVTASYAPPGSPPGTTPVVTPPDVATANVYGLVLAKQACASLNAGDCVSLGVGPWVETANIPSGSSAFWRITATNTGAVDLIGITLDDGAEASCVSAAGSFALAVGASTSFYCRTSNVTVGRTNTVTATFTPPSGTPVTTAPDSAGVNVTKLAVSKDVCTSTVAADCAGGIGPWAESTPLLTGSTAYWRITVTNTGEVDLSGITLADTDEASCVTAAGSFALPAGSSTSIFCSTTGMTSSETNTATASYLPPGAPPGNTPVVTPPDDASVKVHGLAVVKEVCATTTVAKCVVGGAGPWAESTPLLTGTTAYWRITATNTGAEDLTGITLSDAQQLSCAPDAGSFDLTVGAVKSFYCSTSELTVNRTNSVTAAYVPPGSPPGAPPVVTPSDDATANVYGLSLAKEACASLVAVECGAGGSGPWVETAGIPSGSTAFWRITATNTGALDLTGITLDDEAEASCVAAAGSFDLAVGVSTSFYCSTANVLSGRTNTVTATFTPPGGTPVTTPPESASVRVTNLALAKEVCTSTSAEDCVSNGVGPWAADVSIWTGATAFWRITATNTGEVDLTGITFEDFVESSCVSAAGSFGLTASESVSFYCSTSDVVANTTNSATASYLPPGSPPGTPPVVTPPAVATANVYGVSVAKEACASLVAVECGAGGSGPWVETANIPSGTSAFWRITATNTGALDLTGITLTDEAEASCVVAAGSFDLVVGASTSFYCSTSTVTAGRTNAVAAVFTPPGGPLSMTLPDSASVRVTNLAVLKDVCASLVAADCAGAGPWVQTASVPSGSSAFWRITATNTGEVDLTGATLADAAETLCVSAAGSFDLAVGAATSFYCSTADVTAGRTNTVVASYVPPGSPPGTTPVVTPPDDADVTVTNLVVAKEVCASTNAEDCAGGGDPWVEVASVHSGASAFWRIVVTNTGEVDLTGVTLADDVEMSCASGAGSFDLAAGASMSFYCSTAHLMVNTTNSVTASYVPPGAPQGTEPVVTSSDEATANVYDLVVAKQVCASLTAGDCDTAAGPWEQAAAIPSGSTAFWRITVTNTGAIDLSEITLDDEAEASCATAAGSFDLAVGEDVSFYCSTADVVVGLTNRVSATFTPPAGMPVTTPLVAAQVQVTNLAVVKEVCASTSGEDCTNSTGPWVEAAAGPRGWTAYWRITVTNTGEVALSDVALEDPDEVSCESAAGSFDLAVGVSASFYCSTDDVTASTTNAATASYLPPDAPPGSVPVVTPPAEATANVTDLLVRKEICRSTVEADCGLAGSGPWGEDHVVQAAGTAHWRITVSNSGEVDLTGITLNDVSEASCVSTSGSFDLAAGESVSFHCSTANVTADRTNSVTAQYVPPGSPPNTPPVVTLPDDATARVPGMVVAKEVCQSDDATRCGTEAGPWGEVAKVHADGVAYWRITVTNTGGVDLVGVTVRDEVERACATAAGTFDLPIGATKRVYCRTAKVSKSIENTATGVVTLAGGPVVSSSPDSARVELLPAPPPPAAPPLAWTGGGDLVSLLSLGFLLLAVGLSLRLRRKRGVS